MINLRTVPLRAPPLLPCLQHPFLSLASSPQGAPEGPLCIHSGLPASALPLEMRTRSSLLLSFRHSALGKAGCLDVQNTQVRKNTRAKEFGGPNAFKGQRSGSVEVRGLRSWIDHMLACSPSLPHWPILSAPFRKQSNRSFWAPGVQTLNWIS